MDPFAHTFAGAALAASGLRRATPLATAALLIGANAPDVDVVMMFAGDYMALAHRRGITHGVPAMILLPFLLTGVLLAWDRWVRLRFHPDAQPVKPRALLLVCAIAVASHPVLDWLNNYGMRWWLPFDGRWSYGDALFIVDPVAWLVLGGVAFLAWSRRPVTIVPWLLFAVAATWLVMTNGLVPVATRWLWLAGLALLLALRLGLRRHLAEPASMAWPSRVALLMAGCYMLVNVLANIPARAEVRAVLEAHGMGAVHQVMVGPVAGNPFRGQVVAATDQGYVSGDWRWLHSPRFVADGRLIPINLEHPVARQAASDPAARRFLTWARFPYAEVERAEGGYRVSFGDARYPPEWGPGGGPVVWVNEGSKLAP